MSEIITSILGIGDALYSFIGLVCSIWNGFIDAAWGLIEQTPQEISPGSWALVTGSIQDIFTAIGVGLLGVFFLIGYLQNALDLREELTDQKLILLFLQLVLVQAVFIGITRLIPLACNAAKNLVLKIKYTGGIEALHLSPNDLTGIPFDDMKFFSAIIGLLMTVFALIAAVICGGMIVWGILGRMFKIYVLIPIAAVPLSTFAGGSRVNRPAINWIKEFMIAAFEVVLIALVLLIGSTFIGSNALGNFFQFNDSDVLQKTCVAIFMMILNMGIVAGGVKGCEITLRKIFG